MWAKSGIKYPSWFTRPMNPFKAKISFSTWKFRMESVSLGSGFTQSGDMVYPARLMELSILNFRFESVIPNNTTGGAIEKRKNFNRLFWYDLF